MEIMERRSFLRALLAVPGAFWLSGCGGSGNGSLQSRRVTRVKVRIALSPEVQSKLAAAHKTATPTTGTDPTRLIPTNATTLYFSYTTVNPTTGVIAPKTSLGVAINPTLAIPTQTIPDLAAGISNTITVILQDTPTAPTLPASVAVGSTTVNIAPGAAANTTTPINITLQSYVTGTASLTLNAAAVTGTQAVSNTNAQTVGVSGFLNADGTLITTINPANLHWTVSGGVEIVGTATGTSIQVRPTKAGTGAVTVTYFEPSTAGGAANTQINTGTLNLTLTTAVTGVGSITLQNSTPAALPTASAFDVSGDGYTLYYDAALVNAAVDANPGYSRIQHYVPPTTTPVTPLFLDFDTATTPTFVGIGSRLALYTIGAARHAAVISGDGKTLSSLINTPNPAIRGTSQTTFANIAAVAGETFIDIDARVNANLVQGLLYVLEQVTGGYQVRIINATTGVDAGSPITLPALSAPPTNIAAVPAGPDATFGTALYVMHGNNIAQIIVNQSGTSQSVKPNFTPSVVPAFGTLADIATDNAINDDYRFVYAISTTRIYVFSGLDGSQVTFGTLTPTTTGRRLSVANRLITVLETDAGGNAALQRIQLA